MKKLFSLRRKYSARPADDLPRVEKMRGHPFVIPIVTFLALFFVSGIAMVLLGGETMGASDARVVRLTVDGVEQTVPTRARTVKDLLQRLDVEVSEADIVKPALDTLIVEENTEVTVQKARPVTIIDQGRRTTVLSAHQQPRTVVEQAGIELYREDGIALDGNIDISDRIIGEQIVVDRAQEANINLYGNGFAVRTRAKTVGELLEQKDIKTLEGDTVEPARNTKLASGTQVFIVRKGKKVITVEEVIPAPVQTVPDGNMAAGITAVREAGTDGKKLVTYEVEMRNDQEVSRKVLQEVIAVTPVRRVVAQGTKSSVTGTKADWMAAAGISEADYFAVDLIISKESGWNPGAMNGSRCIGLGQRCPSASGQNALLAACPNWQVDPVCQLQHFSAYANGRYPGGWQGAYNFWLANRWW